MDFNLYGTKIKTTHKQDQKFDFKPQMVLCTLQSMFLIMESLQNIAHI